MDQELKNNQVEDPISEQASRIVENLKRSGQQMRLVEAAAKALAKEHPGAFTISSNTNEYMSSITVTTQFEVESEILRLSISMTSWNGGAFEDSINIRQEDKSWRNDGVSYRLDVSQGTQIDKDHERLLELQNSDTTQPGMVLEGLLNNMFGKTDDGELLRYADRYAESTISASTALKILQNYTDLQRPVEDGFVSGMCLKDLLDELDRRKNTTSINPELPSNL